jgi:hypothetical protein
VLMFCFDKVWSSAAHFASSFFDFEKLVSCIWEVQVYLEKKMVTLFSRSSRFPLLSAFTSNTPLFVRKLYCLFLYTGSSIHTCKCANHCFILLVHYVLRGRFTNNVLGTSVRPMLFWYDTSLEKMEIQFKCYENSSQSYYTH